MKHLLTKPHIILSVENPTYPDKAEKQVSHEAAVEALKRIGTGEVHSAQGFYGDQPERSIFISDPDENQMGLARHLAHVTGQDSHIESDGYSHKLLFNHGDDAGKIIHGRGTALFDQVPEGQGYTEIPDGTKFSHKFNFEKSESLAKARIDEIRPDKKFPRREGNKINMPHDTLKYRPSKFLHEHNKNMGQPASPKGINGPKTSLPKSEDVNKSQKINSGVNFKDKEGLTSEHRGVYAEDHPSYSGRGYKGVEVNPKEIKPFFAENNNLIVGRFRAIEPDQLPHVVHHLKRGKKVMVYQDRGFLPFELAPEHLNYLPQADTAPKVLRDTIAQKKSEIKPNLPKSEKISIPKKDFVQEHKKLVNVLRSPSRKDDLAEAKDQQKELDSELEKSKNVREQRKKVFGSDANAPRLSDKRMKMMQRIKQFAEDKFNMPFVTAEGKRDSSGQMREDKANQPAYDVFTPEGQAKEKKLLAQQKKKGIKRVDPKPDWRSGRLETQPSPDAAVHELAHLYLAPEGMSPAIFQEYMDKLWGESQSKYGHMQQKKTRGEVDPMSVENSVRRRSGLPATHPTKPVKQNEPVLDDPSRQRFVEGKDQKGRNVFYDRSTRNQTPEIKQRIRDIDEGTLKFNPQKGWQEANDPDALVNLRGQGRKEEAQKRAAQKFAQPKKMAASEIQKARVDENKTIEQKRAARDERQSSWEKENRGMHSGQSDIPDLAAFKHKAKLHQIKTNPKPNLPKSEKIAKNEVIVSYFDDGSVDVVAGSMVKSEVFQTIESEILKSGYEEITKKEFSLKADHKSDKGGLTEAGRKAYNKATGSNLKRPQPEGGPRKKSFCARSAGQIKMHNIDCRKTPKKRACLARKRWKC